MQHSKVFARPDLDRYFASYVGMEGGNPKAPVWICDRSPACSEPLVAPLQPRMAPPAWDAVFRHQYREDMGKWFGHQCMARIMAAARAEAMRVRLGDNDWEQYYRRHLYSPRGAEFRLSLFPLPAHVDGRTTWSKAFRGQPELIPQSRYLDLCRHGERFRFLAKTRARWRPKVVICLSHRHADEYIEAFSLGGLASEEHALQPADQVRRLRLFTKDGTTWIICPAIGGSAGMTSQVQLDAFGKFLGMRLAESDFKHCAELDAVDDGAPARAERLPERCETRRLPAEAGGSRPVERVRPMFPANEPARAGNCESLV
ncbi:transcriptional regulator [Cupriavidus sp. L7L]|nr:transcriptional regulator [Cupriavidus sp. L7L]